MRVRGWLGRLDSEEGSLAFFFFDFWVILFIVC